LVQTTPQAHLQPWTGCLRSSERRGRCPAAELHMIRYALLALVPVAPVLHYALGLPALWVFAAGILGVGILAEWIRTMARIGVRSSHIRAM